MKTKIVYLAQPIDQAPFHEDDWRSHLPGIILTLHSYGYYTYQPARAWDVGDPPAVPDRRIEQVNDAALVRADLLVAVMPAGVPTIGVPMEIERAIQYRVPVIVHWARNHGELQSPPPSFALDRPGVLQVAYTRDLAAAIERAEEDGPKIEPERLQDPIRIQLADGHEPPQRAYPDDAGLDLTCIGEHILYPGQFADLHTQVEAVQLPDGYWGMITGRSSTLRQHGLHVPVAVIDPGWRGPLYVGVWNLSRNPVTIHPGQRLGQLILIPNNPAAVQAVEKVDDAPRGIKGFGSSG